MTQANPDGADVEKLRASGPDFEAMLPIRLRKIADMFEESAQQVAYAARGLRFTEVRILAYLTSRDHASILEISRDLTVDKAWISRLLRHLGDKGLVTRRKHEDGQRVLISGTDLGRETYATIMEQASTLDPMMYDGLDEMAAVALCDRLEANMSRIKAWLGIQADP